MMLLKELLAQYPTGAVESVVCLERHPATRWVVGKVYQVVENRVGKLGVLYIGNIVVTDSPHVKFGVHSLVPHPPNINPHMKDGKLPTLVTGFNPNIVAVDECKQERSYEELENLIRVGIDIQDALAANAPDLDRALVDLWFELKGTKQ